MWVVVRTAIVGSGSLCYRTVSYASQAIDSGYSE